MLTGAGDAFCAGADFAAATNPFHAESAVGGFTASPIDPAAFELRKPVLAAINGHAIGIGLTIALQADLRIMATDAKYAVAQVRRGVVPDCMAHWTLPHLVGGAVAADLLLTGRTFDGAEAAAMGIATRTLPAAEVLDHTMSIARDIAVNVAPMSVALTKRLLWDTMKGLRPPRGGGAGDRDAPVGDGNRRFARGGGCVPAAARAPVDVVGVAGLAVGVRPAPGLSGPGIGAGDNG